MGEWGTIIIGIILAVGSSFVIAFALMPSLIFAGPAAMALEKGKKLLGTFLGFLSVLYTIALVTVWCIWVMWLFMSPESKSSLIPMLIWSYGVALAPWTWLASKEENDYSFFTIFFAAVSYITGMIMFLFSATLSAIAITFGAIMLVGAVLQMSFAYASNKSLESSKEPLF